MSNRIVHSHPSNRNRTPAGDSNDEIKPNSWYFKSLSN